MFPIIRATMSNGRVCITIIKRGFFKLTASVNHDRIVAIPRMGTVVSAHKTIPLSTCVKYQGDVVFPSNRGYVIYQKAVSGFPCR